MQITVEDKSSVKKILHVEIPETDVLREIESAYEDLKKSVKLKGYRPGKIPRPVLERRFRKNVHADVTSKIIQESFLNAVREHNLNVVGPPRIDPPELNPAEAYRYDATVEIKPPIADIDFRGFALERKRYKTDESEVEKQLQTFRRHLGTLEKVKEARPAADKDIVRINLEGFEGDQPLPNMPKAQGMLMQIGEGRILPEFDSHLIGMKEGEVKTVEIPFPPDYRDTSLAGKTIRFQITLTEIHVQILPELNDELAKTLGNDTLDALRARVMEEIQAEKKRRSERDLYEQVYRLLLEHRDFEVPEIMLNYELESMIMPEIERAFSGGEISEDQIASKQSELMEKHRDAGLQIARRRLVMDKIIEQEKLELTPDEVTQGIAGIAFAMGQQPEEVKTFYRENPERLNILRQSLLEKKAMTLIIEASTITEIEPEAAPEAGGQ